MPVLFLMSDCSGGVMIYFDRIEVVNVLSASAGKSDSCHCAVLEQEA